MPLVGMEPLQIRILRSFGLRAYGRFPQNPDALKPSHVAKLVGVDPKTVKAHLAEMERTGFIRFYQVYPNFSHLGIQGTAFLFQSRDEDRKAHVIQQIEPVEGLLEVHNFLGPSLCVDLSYASVSELDAKLRKVSEFTGDAAPLRFYDRVMPEVRRPLSKLDWRILKAMRFKARRPLSEAANEIGVNLKTFKRHYERMAEEGSFFVVPALDPSRAPGLLLFELLVHTTSDADRSTFDRVLRATDDHWVYQYVPSVQQLGNFDILAFAETTSEIEELRQQVRFLSGVAKVETLLFRGWKDYTGWIDAAIDAKIEHSAR